MGVALVTGGGRHIGAEISRLLASTGHSVIIHYFSSADESEELANELRNITDVATIQADLSSSQNCIDLIEQAGSFFGPINILINNSSHFEYDNIETINVDSFSRSIEINTLAPVILSKAFNSQLIDGSGCVINILDQKINNPNPDYLSYTISKIALSGITETLAMALAPNIRVNGVAPGLTLPSPHASISSFEDVHNKTPLNRGSNAIDIAEAVLFLIGANAITGQIIFVDGGERLIPNPRDVLYRGELNE